MLPTWMRGLRIVPVGEKQGDDWVDVEEIARSSVSAYGRDLSRQCDEYTDERLGDLLSENRPISYDDIEEIARQVAENITPSGYFDAWMGVVGNELYNEIDNYPNLDRDVCYSLLFDYFYSISYDRMKNAGDYGFTDFTIVDDSDSSDTIVVNMDR